MTFFFFLPSILLSGFMFPFDGMPRAAQLLAEFLPLTHFVRPIRGILLRGAALGELAPEIYALLGFMGVALVLATLRLKKRLDCVAFNWTRPQIRSKSDFSQPTLV